MAAPMSLKIYSSALTCFRQMFIKSAAGRANTNALAGFHTTSLCCQDDENEEVKQDNEESTGKLPEEYTVTDLETSLKYMKSKAYRFTYGNALVWQPYRRNHKGGIAPRKTRKTCVRGGVIATGNPCPICRDKYLLIHPENVGLLEQFVSRHTGQLLDQFITGVCQKQQRKLLVALHQAWDRGLIEMPVPHRTYDYKQYYPKELVRQMHTTKKEDASLTDSPNTTDELSGTQ